MSEPAIAFMEVSKQYAGGRVALDQVSFSIDRGTRACLLGPNGAGKSTSIRLLEGAIGPSMGSVCLLGVDVKSPAYRAARRRTGVVPQGPGMYDDLTVHEYLETAIQLYRRGDVRVLVEQFGLGEYRDMPLARLSGGYQRRVVLAAALVGDPELLLLDEPTTGLDPIAAHEIRAMLREAMHGKTTLLCTQNLVEAEELCDDVVILRQGKVLLHEKLAELRGRAERRVRLSARAGAGEIVRALGQDFPVEETTDEDVVVVMANPRDEMPALMKDLILQGIELYRCEIVEPTLESLFVDLVRGDGTDV
jgi:ABC-2 type transport system ATP-binding protein